MTGNEGRGSAPVGQPWSVDLIADLHAGVLDDAAAARLWPQVNADPHARAVIDALESTRTDLAGLVEMPVRIPDQLAARIDTALAAEQAGWGRAQQPDPPLAPVLDLAAARRRRNKMVGWATGIVTAAAAVIGITVAINPGGAGQGTGGNFAGGNQNTQAPPGAGEHGPLALGSPAELNSSLLGKAIKAKDYGPLGDRAKLASCLSAHGHVPQKNIVGARQASMHGKKGVLFVITTGKPGQFRLLAVGTDCARGNPATLGDKTVG